MLTSPEQVDAVREAAEMLLEDAPYGSVYSFLECRHNGMKHHGLEYHQFTARADRDAARITAPAGPAIVVVVTNN